MSVHPRGLVSPKLLLPVAALPAVYLISAPLAQESLLSYCFDQTVRNSVISLSILAATLFSVGYVPTLIRVYRARPKHELDGGGLRRVTWVLLTAAFLYVLVAALRVWLRFDEFSLDPALTRITLQVRRHGITPVGFLNSVLLAAPTAYLLWVIMNIERLRQIQWHKFAAVIMFLIYVLMLCLENGRLAPLTSFLTVGTAIAVQLIRGVRVRSLGFGFLISLATTLLILMCYSYAVFGLRAYARGLTRVASNMAFLQAVERQKPSGATDRPLGTVDGESARRGGEPVKNQELQVDQRAHEQHLERMKQFATGTIGACFYLAHELRSIERILDRGADRNLYGFYTYSYAYKALSAIGLFSGDADNYADYYSINGLYSGLLGYMLIDFGLYFGVIVYLLFGIASGAVIGSIFWEKDSSLLLISPTVPTIIAFAPIHNIVSSLGQSLTVWIVVGAAVLMGSRIAQPFCFAFRRLIDQCFGWGRAVGTDTSVASRHKPRR